MLPIAATAGTSTGPVRPPISLYKVIFDRRFPSSREFGAEARKLGLPVHEIEGDITDLWYHDLSLRWREEPVAIAGLTAHGPLFCLERLAWDHRMRVVFRARHSLWGSAMRCREAGPRMALPHEDLFSWVIAAKQQIPLEEHR